MIQMYSSLRSHLFDPQLFPLLLVLQEDMHHLPESIYSPHALGFRADVFHRVSNLLVYNRYSHEVHVVLT